MNFFEALSSNAVHGITQPCEQVVDSVISKVFLYPKHARKVYRYDDGFVGKLNIFSFRKNFILEDFSWNNLMCPEIYLHVEGATQENGTWRTCPVERAEDFSIVMSRVDVQQDLHHVLLRGAATNEVVQKVADTMMTRLHHLTERKAQSIRTFQQPWRELFLKRVGDLRDWCNMVKDALNQAHVQAVLHLLEQLAEDPYIRTYDAKRMQVAIDNHAGNILIFPHGIEFLDIYQFKEHWLAVDPLVNITRPAADIFVLGNEDLGNAYLAAAKEYYAYPEQHIVTAYLIEAALILEAYQFMLGNAAIAKKYYTWIEAKLRTYQHA